MTAFPVAQDYTMLGLSSEQPDVTVVIPARDRGDGSGQAKLNLVLAALVAQDYPSDKLRVVVVDDGSPTPLVLPPLAPGTTTLLTLEDDQENWGKSRAFNAALGSVATELVMSLDADMVLAPDHVTRMVSRVAACPLAVALGWKTMTTDWVDAPTKVYELCRTGHFADISTGTAEPHGWLEDLTATTNDLVGAGVDAYKAVVGASVLMHTSLLKQVGGYDERMRTAEDTELGYRLVMAGAVVMPVRDAQAWHLGLTSMSSHKDVILAHNHARLAPRVPLLDYLRRPFPGRAWLVPTVLVNVSVTEENAKQARQLVNELAAGRLGTDAQVVLVGQWPLDTRYSVVEDTHAEMRALKAHVQGDPRVTLAHAAQLNAFPAPYRIDVPGHAHISAVRKVLDKLRDGRFGVVAAVGTGTAPAEVAGYLTAAWNRAVAAGMPDDAHGLNAAKAVGRTWSEWWLDVSTLGLDSSKRDVDQALTQKPGTPLRRYAKVAWTSWASAGYRPKAARLIAGGVLRGAARRVRRKAARAR